MAAWRNGSQSCARRAPHRQHGDASRRLRHERDGTRQRGGIAGIDADGHQPHGLRAEQQAGDQRAVAAPLGARAPFAPVERLAVLVFQVPADQLAFAVPGQALRHLRHRVVDARADEGDGHTAGIAAGRQRRLLLLAPGRRDARSAVAAIRWRRMARNRIAHDFAGAPALARPAGRPIEPAMKSAMPTTSSSANTGRPRPSAAWSAAMAMTLGSLSASGSLPKAALRRASILGMGADLYPSTMTRSQGPSQATTCGQVGLGRALELSDQAPSAWPRRRPPARRRHGGGGRCRSPRRRSGSRGGHA